MECHAVTCEYAKGLPPKHIRCRGFALAWTVLAIFVIFLLVGLSLDTAKLCLINHQMHNAADAAALAGAPWVKRDQDYARYLAQQISAKNFADHADVKLDLNEQNLPYGDIIVGRYTYNREDAKSYFFCYDPLAADPIPVNALAVNVSRTQYRQDVGGPIPLVFGSIVNIFTADLEGSCEIRDPDTYDIVPNPNPGVSSKRHGPYAIAVPVGGTGSGLICLRHDLTGLHVHGTAALTLNNIGVPPVFEEGAIYINSFDDELCLTATGTPEINTNIINFTADDMTTKGDFVFPPEPEMYLNFRQPPIPDPLAWLNEGDNKPTNNSYFMGLDLGGMFINNDRLIPPEPIPSGYYSGGLELDAGTEENPIRLSSGIYVLDGDGLKVGSNAVVVAEPGVFFYITGKGECDIDGGAVFTASSMTDGLYKSIIIAQDDLNLNMASIIGGPGFNLEGAMYFPQHVADQKQKTDYALTLGGTGVVFNNQIIADSIYIPGTADIIVNYDGRNPAPISRAYLVE
ncbi:MAG: pilus assembly protein TadG-related protein [Planctomycetota bacterium]|jgi:Flp pilus assembly protein TadG